MRRIAGLTCGLFFLGIVSAAGQTSPAPPAPPDDIPGWQIGIGGLGTVPLGEFGDKIHGAGGVLGHAAVGLGQSVLTLGGEATYLWYGSESREEPWSGTIPDARVTVNTENAMFLMHARLRAQPRHGRWRPYVDGLVGFNYIFTQTSVDAGGSCDNGSSCNLANTTNLDDFVSSFGGSGGLMIGLGSAPHLAKLDISARYLRGGDATYLREGGIRREDGIALLDVTRSRTDMVWIYFGIALGR
jgi:hypothetical protein